MDAIQKAELDNARHGTLYFLGKLEVRKNPSFDLGLVGNFASGTSIVSDLQNGASLLLKSCSAGNKLVDGYEATKKKIKEVLTSFFDAVAERMQDVYGEAAAGLEWLAEFSTWAIANLTGTLADLIPGWGYAQDVESLYQGVKRAVKNAIDWLGQIFSGWGVNLLEGGPATMARSIAQHSAAGLAGGLKDIAVTSCKIGLKAAGDAVSGVGSIVGAVVGILQRIANLVEYSVQRFLLNRTLSQAKYHWEKKSEMMENHYQFNEWFSKACAFTPVVAALCLCSGNVAHPYRFLQLLATDDNAINQKQFDEGVKHTEKLQSLSREYVREYVSVYRLHITSQEDYVGGMLDKIFK